MWQLLWMLKLPYIMLFPTNPKKINVNLSWKKVNYTFTSDLGTLDETHK